MEMADDSQSCDTPLHTAASRGDLDEVRKLLITKQYEVDTRNSHNQTSLHLACANGHLDTVWTLANDFGADIGAIYNGNTPLLIAAKNKHVQIIIVLILLSMLGRQVINGIRLPCSFSHTELDSHHVKIFEDVLFEYYNNSKAVDKTMQMISNFFLDQYNDVGFFALLVAASLGLKDLIDRLVVEKKADLNIKGFRGLSVLHCACYGGHVLLVESLASKYGLNPADRDDIGNTPLHIAAMKGHIETVRHLISKQSCKLDGIDNQSNTPLMLAALTGNSHVLDALVKEFNSSCHVRGYKGRTLLHQACNGGHIELIDKLVMEQGLDLADRDDSGDTPLHIASMSGHVEAVRHLISKHSADIDCTNKNNNTPLILAMLSGHTHVLDAFVKEFNSSCHVRGYNGCTLLHYACIGGYIELMNKLVMEYGLDPADRDDDGNTPLHIAAMTGHVEIVRHLIIKHSADIDCTNNKSNTPLMLAALNGHAQVLDAFVNEFNSSCHVRGYNGRTLLHQACDRGHVELIDTLVMEYGLNPADRDDDGNTPLHIASIYGHVEAVRHLISRHNADVDCTDNRSNTPLMLAARTGNSLVIDALVKEFKSNRHVRGYNGRALLHKACYGGHIELIDKLVNEYGLKLVDRDNDGDTPLHIAAMTGHVETVRHLISKHSADIDCTNNKSNTPLMLAALNGHAQVLDAFVNEFNSSCHVRGYNGRTLLHQACDRGHVELIDTLVMEYGLNPADRNGKGNTPLHIAAMKGHVEAVRHLISKHSADIDSINNKSNTPLMLAALNGHAHVLVAFFKEFNSSCHVRSYNGCTLLHYACEGGHIEVIDIMVMEYGLNPEDRNSKGNTPLHIAAMKGHVEAVRHLISKHGADVDCINKTKSTPLMLAVLSGHVHVLDALVKEFNSSCHVRGYNDRTLLHQACDRGHIELIDKLVMKYGLSPEDRNFKGNTPLHIAACEGRVETVKHLIRNHKVETNITNNKDSTPLCLAAQGGHQVVLHALIEEFHCNPHVRGYNGQTLLHYACKDGHIETLKTLKSKYKVDPTIRDNDGNTPLHILCRAPHTEEEKLRLILCKFQYWTVFQVNNNGNTPLHTATRYGQARCARVLLQKCNAPLFVRNKDGKTAFDLAKARKSQEIITLFKHHNSEIQSTYQQLYKLAEQDFGGEKYLTRIFVVGHPGAGKSTLVETIKKEGFFSFFSTSTIKLHTAGIVPSTYDSNAYGRMILYDFAGDFEYYSSHAAIMESIDTSKGSNIYLIICDLSEGEKEAATKYSYWLSFLSYNIKQFSHTVILLVGSHADVIKKPSVEHALSVLDSISQKFCSNYKINDAHIERSVALDCRKRGAVVNDIKKLANRFSKFVSPIGLSPETSTLLGLLKKDFEQVSACKVSLLISHIEETGIPLPLNSLSLYTLIRELHELGLLMLIEREGDSVENHIIILKISTFTSDVHSKLFSKSAKADLTKHIDQLKLSVGIIPESLLERVLPEYITKESLLKLQYCQEIENLHVEEDHTLSQLTSETVLTENTTKEKSHLFFPALCDLKLEEIQWPKSEGDKITLGWYAKCDDDGFDFFPTRFLHVLIVHLSHSFALKQDLPTRHRLSIETAHYEYSAHNSSLIAEVHAANRRCRVWSTGLHWLMKNGVEVFVDMPKDANNKELIVLARSKVQNQVECANTLRAVIQKTANTKFEFCASIVPTVYLLDPNNLEDETFTNARTAPKYSLRDIEKALAEGTLQVTDKDGEYFSTPIRDWISPTRLVSSYWSKSHSHTLVA